jgi:hypothetical protein
VLLGAIEEGEGGEEEEESLPTARIKTRWNACCALASVLTRLVSREVEEDGGRRPWGGRAVRSLVHTLMTDGNAKVCMYVLGECYIRLEHLFH